MKAIPYLLSATLLLCNVVCFGQRSQLLIAKNAVGKISNASKTQNSNAQIAALKEGLQAADKATTDKCTKRYTETWAIKGYLNSVAALNKDIQGNKVQYIATAATAIDTAKQLDRFDDNNALVNAALANIKTAQLTLAHDLYRKKDYPGAYQVLNNLTASNKKDTLLLLNTGIAAQQAKLSQPAIALYSGLSNVPEEANLLALNNSALLAGEGNVDSALVSLRAQQNDKYSNLIAQQRVNFLLVKKDYSNAAKELNAFLIHSDKIAEKANLWLLYGAIQQQYLNAPDIATDAFNTAIDLDNKNVSGYINRGINALIKANEVLQRHPVAYNEYETLVNSAQADLQTTLLLQSNNQTALKLLLEIYMRKNDFDNIQQIKKRITALSTEKPKTKKP